MDDVTFTADAITVVCVALVTATQIGSWGIDTQLATCGQDSNALIDICGVKNLTSIKNNQNGIYLILQKTLKSVHQR